MRVLYIVIGLPVILSLIVSLAPEPPAKVFGDFQVAVDPPGIEAIPFSSESSRWNNLIRNSIRKGGDRVMLWRSLTADGNVQPLSVEMSKIPRVRYLAVGIQGTMRGREHHNSLTLHCSDHDCSLPVATGGTHTRFVEAVVPLSEDWCQDGHVTLNLRADSTLKNAGVTNPYEISLISFLKRSYLGLLSYFLTAFLAGCVVFFFGGLVFKLLRTGLDPTLGGLIGLGTLSLVSFYLHAWASVPPPYVSIVILGVMIGVWRHARKTPNLVRAVWRAQREIVAVWFIVAFMGFTFLYLGSSNSGSWEPNSHFAPAVLSTDNELPAIGTEAARRGSFEAKNLLGNWSLSDRPPLLTGAYLLFADIHNALQLNNDGHHLRRIGLGVGGIVFCALWAVSFYWAARRILRLRAGIAALSTFVLAMTPFAFYNTIYTWPKLYAVGFSLAATAYAFRPYAGFIRVTEAVVFGLLAAFAMLSHFSAAFFLLPVSVVYFATRLRKSLKAAVIGAMTGLILLGTWTLFQHSVAPSNHPLTKYALSGNFGFDQPNASLHDLVSERYRTLSFKSWLDLKLMYASFVIMPPYRASVGAPRSDPMQGSMYDIAGKLRNWDLYSLAAGNLSILLMGMAGIILVAIKRDKARNASMAKRIFLCSFITYCLFFLIIFVPLINHNTSYDAIVALAMGGVAMIASQAWGVPILAGFALTNSIYSLIVWIILPLKNMVYLDPSAFIALGIAGFTAAFVFWRHHVGEGHFLGIKKMR